MRTSLFLFRTLSILFILCVISVPSLYGQDKIVRRNSTTVSAKILVIDSETVSYKLFDNQDGPTMVERKSDLKQIVLSNGTVLDFDTVTNESGPQEIIKQPDERNAYLISHINLPPKTIGKKSRKKADQFVVFLGVSEDSVISNDEVELTLQTKFYFGDVVLLGDRQMIYAYDLVMTNKTDHYLYVDKASSFFFDNANVGYPLYSGKQISSVSGRMNGAGLSLGAVSDALGIGGRVGSLLGGIDVSGARISLSQVTEVEQQIVAIPPRSSAVCLSGCKIPDLLIADNFVNIGGYYEYSYTNSPTRWTYFITYSGSQEFNTYSCLTMKAYCHYIWGMTSKWATKGRDFIPPAYGGYCYGNSFGRALPLSSDNRAPRGTKTGY